MKLYSGSSAQFIEDATFNRVADRLKSAFFDTYGFNPSEGEQRSWQNSLRALSNVFQFAQFQSQGILLEYQLPLTSRRLDCMVTGRSRDGRENAVIIELKQWEESTESDGENEVLTYIGGGLRDVLHPSVQVGRYQMYLKDTHTAFYEDDAVSLSACSYLHNYPFFSADAIFAPKFLNALQTWPLFTKDDVDKLEEYLIPRVSEPGGLDILRRVEDSEYRPSKKLMNHVAEVIDGKPEYVLLDEQLIVYDKVLAAANRNSEAPHVVLVKGGPGTGKSVIAINLMADLLRDGKNAQYATGSKAFTETLRTAIGVRGSVQFKYFNSYMDADRDSVDVLICDEAHRIRQHSHNRFTKKQDRTNKLQVDELLEVSRVSVFFLDDDQVVSPGEIGSVDLIKHLERSESVNTSTAASNRILCRSSYLDITLMAFMMLSDPQTFSGKPAGDLP